MQIFFLLVCIDLYTWILSQFYFTGSNDKIIVLFFPKKSNLGNNKITCFLTSDKNVDKILVVACYYSKRIRDINCSTLTF